VIEMYRAGRTAVRTAGELTVPLLVLHGEADPIVPVSSSRAYFSAVATRDKELVILPDFLHEAHQEVGQESVVARVVEWVAGHGAGAKL
jgi:alpha-beta hydrolase superfamily lysophospholipase